MLICLKKIEPPLNIELHTYKLLVYFYKEMFVLEVKWY